MTNQSVMKISGTKVLAQNLRANTRIVVNQGGTRSSKTYSIAQKYIIKLLENRSAGKVLTISRKTMPSLKASCMRDFFEILAKHNLYNESLHNKTENTYILAGNLVEFVSMDQPQKKRGTKRNYLWMNEANEFTKEDYRQLSLRTTEEVVLDYNPSDEYHWIYDEVLPRPDCTFIKSTYRDNPYLSKETVREIEHLAEVDKTAWKVYGLGEKASSSATIYQNWTEIQSFPDNCDTIGYGIDFGFNSPSVVLKIGIKDKRDIFVDELIYQTKLTNSDLVELTKTCIQSRSEIIADSADPDKITEFARAGFNIKPAYNGPTSVENGIDYVKTLRLHITSRSVNTLKEIKFYKWREDKDGRVLDKPLKFNDHAMDALRYYLYRGGSGAKQYKIWSA